MRRIPQYTTFISGVATARTAGWRVSDYRNCNLVVSGSSNANMTVFVKGGIGRGAEFDTSPNFKVNKAERNEASKWDFIEVVDLEDGAAIDGDTGVALSGNVIRMLEVNINALDWIAVEVTSVVAGTCTIVGAAYTNQ